MKWTASGRAPGLTSVSGQRQASYVMSAVKRDGNASARVRMDLHDSVAADSDDVSPAAAADAGQKPALYSIIPLYGAARWHVPAFCDALNVPTSISARRSSSHLHTDEHASCW